MSTQPPAGKVPQIVAIKLYVEARANNLEKLMRGTGLNLERFLTLALNQTLQTPSLLACTRESWFDALQKCATHGLLPDGIHGALVPYKDKVQFIPMLQGLVQRAYETKMVSKIWAEVVYQGERFDVRLGDDPKLTHEPDEDRGDAAKLRACYACARVNGETHFVVLFAADVARHRASSRAGRSDSPWNTHTAEMWKKTAISALSKTLPHFSAEGRKFAEVVNEGERADAGEIIDVSFMDVAPEPAATLEAAKEKLRAAAPPESLTSQFAGLAKAFPPEHAKPEREPGSDDGDDEKGPLSSAAAAGTLGVRGSNAPCDHRFLKTLKPGSSTTSVTCQCGMAFSIDELRDFQVGAGRAR